MSLGGPVRRVVTGHDDANRAIIVADGADMDTASTTSGRRTPGSLPIEPA